VSVIPVSSTVTDKMKKTAFEWIEKNRETLIEISDAIWEYAELGFVEFKSAKLLADELESHGFEVERGVAGIPTAFVATWGAGKPVIGINGEYDALPGISNKALPHQDPLLEGAPGHGCGHNIHGSSGLGGALGLKAAMEAEEIPGTIKYFGCPAEEMLSGKVWMVREGIYDGVDACLSHHPFNFNTAGVGSTLANNSVKFHFYGKTAHAAGSPEQGRSALDAVELMNIGVNYMREHVIEKARIHYVIEEGGGQPNVVPDYARVWYLIRAPERDQVDHIHDWVCRIAEGAALMTGTTHEVELAKAIFNLLPNRTLAELVIANMREVGAPEYTEEELKFARKIGETVSKRAKIGGLRAYNVPNWKKYMDVDFARDILDPWDEGRVMPGSTDVSDVSWNTPTTEFYTTGSVLGSPGHSWRTVATSGMSIGHKSLIFAAKTMAGAALELMTNKDLLKKAQDEHKKRLAGRKYKSPLPPDAKPPLDQWA
jgi:aminobenzoyl-glutamate utilization protein B